jgi:hypothetical protein
MIQAIIKTRLNLYKMFECGPGVKGAYWLWMSARCLGHVEIMLILII